MIITFCWSKPPCHFIRLIKVVWGYLRFQLAYSAVWNSIVKINIKIGNLNSRCSGLVKLLVFINNHLTFLPTFGRLSYRCIIIKWASTEPGYGTNFIVFLHSKFTTVLFILFIEHILLYDIEFAEVLNNILVFSFRIMLSACVFLSDRTWIIRLPILGKVVMNFLNYWWWREKPLYGFFFVSNAVVSKENSQVRGISCPRLFDLVFFWLYIIHLFHVLFVAFHSSLGRSYILIFIIHIIRILSRIQLFDLLIRMRIISGLLRLGILHQLSI